MNTTDIDNQDSPQETTPEELARIVKEWRGGITARRAAQLLGMSPRTLEGIEQGKGFRYPLLLILAIKSFE